MQIIKKITENNKSSFLDPNEIQQLCLERLRSNPLPSKESETWRLSNHKKLSKLLNYEHDKNFQNPIIPEGLKSTDVIRLNIGLERKTNLENNHWKIKELEEKEIIGLTKNLILKNNCDENWGDILNHCLCDKQAVLGVSISGNQIPPIELFCSSLQDNFNSQIMVIFVEENTEIDLLQVNISEDSSALSLSTFLFLQESAKVNHGIVSYGDQQSNLINSLKVIQQSKSEYNLGSVQLKFDFARFDIRINQIEGNAKTIIKSIQMTKNNEQISTHSIIEFNGSNGFLDQLSKSLANDQSHSIFEGSIIVPKVAQKTDASQLSRNLLLSNQARIDTKPQLEIIADDVKCKHGATISQLNEDELFYMRSRGLTLEESSKLQLKSYYQEIISFLPISVERWDLLDCLLGE